MAFAGFDSAPFRYDFNSSVETYTIKALLGVGTKTKDLGEFTKAYDKALDDAFSKQGKKRNRKAYSASELSAIFGPSTGDREEEVLLSILKSAAKHLEEIHFYYTYLFGFTAISAFGFGPGAYERIPVVSKKRGVRDYFDLIEPSYSMLCAWKYSTEQNSDFLLVDNFQGQSSPAWNEFYGTKNVGVFYNGDRCNALISTADLFTRLIKLRLLKTRPHFNKRQMEILLPEFNKLLKLDFLGSYYLKKMTPNRRVQLKNQEMLQHPIYFIIREETKDEAERQTIEASPKFGKLLDHAFKNNGSVKFFHPNDTRIIREEDGAITLGPNGEKILKRISKLGAKLKDLSDLI